MRLPTPTLSASVANIENTNVRIDQATMPRAKYREDSPPMIGPIVRQVSLRETLIAPWANHNPNRGTGS